LTEKACSVCKEIKPLSSFYREKRRQSGRGSRCRECSRQYLRSWYSKNKDRANEQRRNPKRRNEMYFYVAKHTYGITKNQVLAMSTAQHNSCAICGKPQERRLHIDHDHKTSAVRGLLCARCNTGLGVFKEQPELLRKAAFYLESREEFDARKIYAA